ncbi:MAG: ABC-ATPase domain-containing protein [Nitrospina sp.]|nr:ABC-ATPase domain-containing protein [Nitrospina sp.]MBT3415512.1 ABC-ATPase domain-containing protein [Nitrospina sp.]MBT3855839.1 ABC-ATPase domain-containing protein [Nitrospina sp.]MBT4104626.1 ABC-ATPase domain-containing protein [Nitrospina sp.]MBT4390850.1 ABC-ATPase domain-containing protein [Nitrospina sp.]
MPAPQELLNQITSLNGKGYKSYKNLQGKSFSFDLFQLTFEHVQGDPFAAPSRLSIKIGLETAGFAKTHYENSLRKLALEDHLLREVSQRVQKCKGKVKGSGRSGEVAVQSPGQKIIRRSGMHIKSDSLTLTLFAGLPGDGRRVLAEECVKLFSEILPPVWEESLLAKSLDMNRVQRALDTLEDYSALSELLDQNHWASFVADGSLLPRASGISDLPLKKDGVLFSAPEEMSAEVHLPHSGKVRGMPIPLGITLIVGGGFHGKSTLLKAIQDAVYPHVAEDGREGIATQPTAVKIRAEDGRSVQPINISGFMDNLPLIASTKNFSTVSASGSTSQAVNILEAIEAGSSLLLMDEDTCATNFMIRDARMQTLITSEPITPLVDRIEELHKDLGVSTLLVMGGSGDYFDSADTVIAMDSFQPKLVTAKAKQIVQENPGSRKNETSGPLPEVPMRTRNLSTLDFSRGKKLCVIQTQKLISLILGRTEIDVRYIEHLVEPGQLELCGWILKQLKGMRDTDANVSNSDAIKNILRTIENGELESVAPFNNGLLALPRLQDVMATLNRLR